MNPQLEGIEDIPGTYVFDLRVSQRTLKLNRFLWRLKESQWRERFSTEPEQLMTEAGLTPAEKQLIRTRDWIGIIRYGAIFFALEKLARVSKTANLEVYAKMRGESFEDFLKSRRVPAAQ